MASNPVEAVELCGQGASAKASALTIFLCRVPVVELQRSGVDNRKVHASSGHAPPRQVIANLSLYTLMLPQLGETHRDSASYARNHKYGATPSAQEPGGSSARTGTNRAVKKSLTARVSASIWMRALTSTTTCATLSNGTFSSQQ